MINDFPQYFFGEQGWVCPKCGRVFSPRTYECLYCNSSKVVKTSTTTELPQEESNINSTNSEGEPCYIGTKDICNLITTFNIF